MQLIGWPPNQSTLTKCAAHCAIFNLYRRSRFTLSCPAYARGFKALVKQAQWLSAGLDRDVQIVPVRVFWGAPRKEKSFFRIWLQMGGTFGGHKNADAIIWNGRNTFVHFSRPFAASSMKPSKSLKFLHAKPLVFCAFTIAMFLPPYLAQTYRIAAP